MYTCACADTHAMHGCTCAQVADFKMEKLPLGIDDALEGPGQPKNPRSVTFAANTSSYLSVLQRAQAQPKTRWLFMQMGMTHPERIEVSEIFNSDWGDAEVRVSKAGQRTNPARFLTQMGTHRFVVSPRGNGLDSHRTWEALLVGCIPIVRSSKLDPLYARLPVLIVSEWRDVTPTLLRNFYAKVSSTRALYDYNRLFADYWIGNIRMHQERCLAAERAAKAPPYAFDYNAHGGWQATDGSNPPARLPGPGPRNIVG